MWIFVKPDNIWDIKFIFLFLSVSISYLFLFFPIFTPVLIIEMENDRKSLKGYYFHIGFYLMTIPHLPFPAPTTLAFLLFLKLPKSSLHQGHFTHWFLLSKLFISFTHSAQISLFQRTCLHLPSYIALSSEIHIIREHA